MTNDVNPFEAPAYEPVEYSVSKTVPKGSLFVTGVFSLVGTALAGAVFGIIGSIVGIVIGFIIALIAGTPVTLFVFLLLAFFSPPAIPKYRVIVAAALSGAGSGMLACTVLLGLSPQSLTFGSIAACLGAIGAASAVALTQRSAAQSSPGTQPPATWGDLE